MEIIGCGIMLTGLLSGALFGNFFLAIAVIAFGGLFIGYQWVKEKEEEERQNAWRKNYPVYRY